VLRKSDCHLPAKTLPASQWLAGSVCVTKLDFFRKVELLRFSRDAHIIQKFDFAEKVEL